MGLSIMTRKDRELVDMMHSVYSGDQVERYQDKNIRSGIKAVMSWYSQEEKWNSYLEEEVCQEYSGGEKSVRESDESEARN